MGEFCLLAQLTKHKCFYMALNYSWLGPRVALFDVAEVDDTTEE